MKKYLFIYLFICLSSCKTTTNYYHGYVLDQKKSPISDVRVREFNKIPLSTSTDSTGYFQLSKDPDYVSNLIFEKEGYQTDTIRTIRIFERRTFKRFINKVPDTLILNKR